MNVTQITRLEPNGPDNVGLEEWEQISPDGLIEGTPVQRGYMYYEDPATGLMAGAWDCTPMTGVMEPYSVHEFMHILEGAVTIVHEDGSELTVSAGERFVIPKGTVCSWKQTGYIRKYFVIFDDPSGVPTADPASLRAFKIDTTADVPASAIADPSVFVGDVPDQGDKVLYEDPTGQFSVGLWRSGPFDRTPATFNRCEMMLPLEGAMTLIGDGRETAFGTGDAAFVPVGADYRWKSTVPVTKIYCIFMANEA